MRLSKTKGMYWSLMISFIMLAMPMWALANSPGAEPNIDQIKQMRQLQNQGTIVKHLKDNSVQTNSSQQQERMLRLSKALSKATNANKPNLKKGYSLQLINKNIQVPQVQQNASREVTYNSGVLSSHADSLYFNFLTGLNSSDSIGMDVRITSNEGTNFGNEGASWGDPSMLFYFSPDGSLDEVYEAPLLTDPVWTPISWDWTNGNAGQPLAVGNIWVVYARTSNMYVALEVTNVDTWGAYFEFDYMIQDDGTNLFDEIPPSLFDMTVNDLYADTLEIGSNPYFEITLDTEPMGEFMIFWDANHNGLWDDMDMPMEMYEFADNDDNDEDPAMGVFGFTYTDEMADGINYLADDILFVAFAGMNTAETSVHFYSNPSPFTISGTAWIDVEGGFQPQPGIVVWAFYDMDEQPSIVGITDESGHYHLNLPSAGMVVIGSEDHFYMTDGLVPNPPTHLANVAGHEDGFDFLYEEPSSAIQGYVYDETGAPVADIEVLAQTDGTDFSSYTDEDGFYYIGVTPGYYMVEIDWWSLTTPYMLPFGEDAEVDEDQTVDVNLYVHTTNSTIGGTVQVDAMPYEGAFVWAMHPDFGYSVTFSDDQGEFVVPVVDTSGTLYDMGAQIEMMPNLIPVTDNHDVLAGTTDELIALESLTGGLSGMFINGETGDPIENAWEVGMSMYNTDTGMGFWVNPHPDGSYEIWVPDGQYEIMAGGMNWYSENADTLMVDGDMINYDVILWPIGFDTFFEGYVYDNLGSPIADAEVMIGNEDWGSGTYTDMYGFFHFDVPAGFYMVGVSAEGFFEQYDEVDLTDGPQFYNFYLDPFEVDGAIAGIVYDLVSSMPIMDAEVYVYGEDMMYNYYTGPDGEFWFDLPNGSYDLYVEHHNFVPFWYDEILVQNDTIYIDAGLDAPDGGIEGYVYDNDMGFPIMDAEIVLVSLLDSIGFWGYSDDNGYFSIPVMNGDYEVFAHAPGYDPANLGMITITNSWEYLDIYLETREFAMAPEINWIIDNPNDQGRQVRMQFWPGGTEWGPFVGYSVWRLTNTPVGEIFDFVDYIPNHDFEAYNLVAPTLVDSSAFNPEPENYMTLFMVTGHFDMYGYIDGMPALGYSIDNIHPGIPGPLALLSSGEAGVEIGWEASMADDFQYFEVLRSSTPDLADPTIFATVAPIFLDEAVSVGETYYYAVSAIDANGNASEATNTVNTSIVSVDGELAVPTVYGLSQNFPNPFNPTTSIEFGLPEASNVSLEIYNMLGQKVRTLVNGYMPAGYITTNWNGLDQNGNQLSSGTYIYRLETADMSFAKKMVLMK